MRLAVWAVGVVAFAALAGCDKRKVKHHRPEADHVCAVDCHHHHHDGATIVITRGHCHGAPRAAA